MTGRGTSSSAAQGESAIAGPPGGIISTDPARHRDMRDTTSLIANDDIGRGGMLHSDDVVAGIDMVNLARDAAREITEEIHRGIADFLDRHAATERRVVLVPFQDVAEVANARRRQGLDRT